MKKTLLAIAYLLIATALSANMQGHFFMNVEHENVSVSAVTSKFSQWLDLPANTTFTNFRDETDSLGIRHLSYQQSVNGTEVAHGMVLVHAKNNVVFAVNGDIMDSTIAAQLSHRNVSPLKAAQKVRKYAESSDAQLKIIRAYIDGRNVFRYAYEVLADDYSAKKYVDAETGDVIKSIPLKYNADVTGTVTTMYNGVQTITCYEDDGVYYLFDEGRGIYTLDGTNNSYHLDTTNTDVTQELSNIIAGCSAISNTSSIWSSSWNLQLKTITINSILPNSTWYSIGEDQADVYLKIKDANGGLLYTSGYKNDPTLPTKFTINANITSASLPLTVEVWDYDPIGDDDIVDVFGVETMGGDNLSITWQGVGSYSLGSYECIGNGFMPHFDAHWGMEKTLDFYRQKLNRNSYDNEGAVVYQLINVPIDEYLFSTLPQNAFAIQIDPFPMVYGTGIISVNSNLADMCVRSLVSIDIMAHEFTHLVTSNNGNGGLVYLGESGALNESFSDIIGIAVKKYATGQNDWLIGSDMMINLSNLRSMKQPNNSYDGIVGNLGSPQPDTYGSGVYWQDPHGTSDKGGVHTNSGVQNFWFYLLSEGGNGTNDIGNIYKVMGIGIDNAVQIAYRNLIYYLTPEATHEDARNGAIQSAKDLYGINSQEYQSVANAWHAVGVSDRCPMNLDTISIKAKMPSNWGTSCSAWVWVDGSDGNWTSLIQEGEWFSYTSTAGAFNIIFVNGYTWDGDNNQTVDIAVSSDVCIQIDNNTSGKRTYTDIDCPIDPHNCLLLPYSESFSSSQGNFTIENVNLDGLNYVWNFASGYGMKASAYVNQTYHATESWLISPCLEFPEESTIDISFDHVYRYTSSPRTQLTLLVSENYVSGDPSLATWTEISIPTYSSGNNWTFVNSGNIDLSSYSGKNVTLAFRYISTTTEAATWEIKNVNLTATSIITNIDEIEEDQKSTKLIENGQLYILLPDGTKYSATGKKVE